MQTAGEPAANAPKLRVRFVIGTLQRGGAETHLSQLLPVLKQRGHDVAVFVGGPRGELADELARHGVSIVPEKPILVAEAMPAALRRFARFAVFVPKFLKFAVQSRGSIFHVFLPETVIVCGLLLMPFRKRLLISQRSMMNYRAKYPRFVTRLERFVFKHARLVLANSEAVADELRNDGVPDEKIRLIYNGLSTQRLSPSGASRASARQKLGMDDEVFAIFVVANLFAYKGYGDLVAALGLAKTHLPQNWQLLCIGRDVESSADPGHTASTLSGRGLLEKRAAELGLAGHIQFLGERADAPELLRAADICVLPSHEEGFSNALIEMMAAEMPVIATRVGGAREALDGGKAGLLVPPKNPQALAEALRTLANDKQLRQTLGTFARQRALELYTIEQCASAYEQVYREI